LIATFRYLLTIFETRFCVSYT